MDTLGLHLHWQEWLAGGIMWGLLAHMARTIPPVNNVWGAWIVGGIQWILANHDKSRDQFASAKQTICEDQGKPLGIDKP